MKQAGLARSKRIMRDAISSLRSNRSRSFLMMLGPAAGVALLSATMITTQGARNEVMGLIAKHGLDMIMIRAGGEVQVFAPTADRGLSVLFAEDALAIEREVPGVQMVSPVQNQRGITVVARDRSVVTRAFGVDSDWMSIRRWGVAEGEFISDADVAGASRVVLLAVKVARELFPDGGASGQTVRINNDPYVVKGVFVEMGTDAGGDDWDNRVVVPYTTSTRRLFNRPSLEQIVLRVNNASRVAETAERVRALMRVRHQIGQGKADDFFVREPEDVGNAATETSSTLWTLLLVVSLVGLVGGGFATANLMMAGVSQRMQEIGIRRATGAREADINQQFVTESLVISLGGGMIGVVVGVAAALGLEALGLARAHLTWAPFAVAFLASAVVGMIVGTRAAGSAARLDPATAVRTRTA